MALVQGGFRALPLLPFPVEVEPRPARPPRRKTPVRFLRRRSRIGAAASVAFLAVSLAALALLTRDAPSPPETSLPIISASAPFDLGFYLEALDHAGRLPALPPEYRAQRTSDEEALRAVARTVELDLKALPPALRLEEAAVIERDGFRLAQLVYQHPRGTLLVFAQPRDVAVSFSGFPAETTVIEARRCLAVRCGLYRAYCFSTDETTYTIVGREGDPLIADVFRAISLA